MEEISTDKAPASIGPYSQGIVNGDTVYVSGQGPIDPESNEIIDGDIRDETRRTIKNIEAVLKSAGTSLENVVKSTVFVQNMDDYDAVNDVYGEYMGEPYPARSAVQVEDLPVDINVEIEVIATVE